MKELHVKGLANHGDHESGIVVREGTGEAKDSGTCGPSIEPRNHVIQNADPVKLRGRSHLSQRNRELRQGSARSETSVHVWNPSAREPGDLPIAHPTGRVCRSGNARCGKPGMYGQEKSDELV